MRNSFNREWLRMECNGTNIRPQKREVIDFMTYEHKGLGGEVVAEDTKSLIQHLTFVVEEAWKNVNSKSGKPSRMLSTTIASHVVSYLRGVGYDFEGRVEACKALWGMTPDDMMVNSYAPVTAIGRMLCCGKKDLSVIGLPAFRDNAEVECQNCGKRWTKISGVYEVTKSGELPEIK
tara:strand:- start:532 stop:1062 length:531 start_codon:yes stop_codon:yes gene_type:complete